MPGDELVVAAPAPGVCAAVHTGSAKRYQIEGNDELEFGSRVLFEPELGIGVNVNERM